MNRCFIFILALLTACGPGQQSSGDKNGKLPASLVNNPRSATGMDTVAAAMKPTLEFTDTVHNFGVIKVNEVVSYDFSYVNKGKTPLIISSAFGSCGCTVPNYSSEPVPPGKPMIMKVTFNSAGKFGHQEKSVTIHDNTLRGEHMLYITADISTK